MDELKPSPRNELLFSIAEKLRGAPAKLGRANPILGRLSEMVLGDIPKGLEHWAYGDSPLGPPANAPAVRLDRALPMLEAAPIGVALKAPGEVASAALYAGTKHKDLMLSHGTELSKLLRGGDLPKELYNTSFGIKKNDLMTDFGSVQLIPNLGKFDPKTSPSTLHAFDAYTPRTGSQAGERIDDLLKDIDGFPPQELQSMKREVVDARLADRLVSTFRKGGLGAEITGVSSKTRGLPEYGQGGYRINGSPMIWEQGNPDAMQLRQMSYGHRFPSFKAYEESPGGAARLSAPDDYTKGYQRLLNWIERNPLMAERNRINDKDLKLEYVGESPRVRLMLRNAIAGNKADAPKYIKEARDIAKMLRGSRADYAELKNWGPLQLNKENFAGIIADSSPRSHTAKDLRLLENAAKRRGLQFDAIPWESVFDEYKPADLASDMQKHWKK